MFSVRCGDCPVGEVYMGRGEEEEEKEEKHKKENSDPNNHHHHIHNRGRCSQCGTEVRE